jgi:hypothetical protein
MLSHCLNPACKAPFRYLYDGRIFTAERFITRADEAETKRVIEHYWLCGSCSRSMKVVVENGVARVSRTLELMAPTKTKSRQLLFG